MKDMKKAFEGLTTTTTFITFMHTKFTAKEK
jgi:hypothetical protein